MAFHTTRWSLVQRAAGSGDEAQGALHELCMLYWPPVYRFYRRAVAPDQQRAEDLTQGLFAQLLERESLGQATPERGRFRTWLLACAQHHLSNEQAAATASKRGGGRPLLALDFASEEGRCSREPVDPRDGPEQAYTRRWVATLVERVLELLSTEFERRGRRPVFAAARPFLDPGSDPGPMREAAQAAGTTEGAFKVAVHRLRESFHERLRDEIEQTLEDGTELDAELAHLRGLLVRG